MASVEQLKVLKANEACRKLFYESFTPKSTLTKDQLGELTAQEVIWIEELVRDILWSSMERRSTISTVGPEVEEIYLEPENKLPLPDTFVQEECTPSELSEVQEGVWAQITRLVAERNLSNGLEIMNLYDEINQPYFRYTWLQVCRARDKVCHLKAIEEVEEENGMVPDIEIVQETNL